MNTHTRIRKTTTRAQLLSGTATCLMAMALSVATKPAQAFYSTMDTQSIQVATVAAADCAGQVDDVIYDLETAAVAADGEALGLT